MKKLSAILLIIASCTMLHAGKTTPQQVDINKLREQCTKKLDSYDFGSLNNKLTSSQLSKLLKGKKKENQKLEDFKAFVKATALYRSSVNDWSQARCEEFMKSYKTYCNLVSLVNNYED